MAALKSSNNGVAPEHPGKMVERAISNLGTSQSEVARVSGITFQRINGIIGGRRGVSVDSALKIEQTLPGVSAYELLIAQAAYDLHALRPELAKGLKKIKPITPAVAVEK